ncbi:glycerophosphodiester phosphodiesterase [candidate division KSB1 bacterium]
MNKIRIVGHRGASGYAPENTIISIEKAIEMKSDYIEVDVQQTSDNKVILMHDNTLDRTSNGTGDINSKTYNDIKQLDAGSWFDEKFKNERIPLLSDVLDLVKGKTGIIIEIKTGSQIYPDIEKNVLSLIKTHDLYNDAVVSSSRVTILNNLYKLDKSIRLAKILVPGEFWRTVFGPDSFIMKQNLLKNIKEIHPHKSFIDKNFIEWAVLKDLTVIPWTVNKERKIRAIIDRGANGVITNFPDIAVKIFD